jgi:hypothetical protein
LKRNPDCRSAALTGLLLLIVTGFARPVSSGTKFYSDDPIQVQPETQDASRVVSWDIDLFYDLMMNQFARPGLPPGNRAGNINTIDEVPDSSWFTNRILSRTLTTAEVMRGAITSDGLAPGKLTVIRAKTEGAAPGFTVRDSAGVTWFIAFDPKSNPEASSGAAVIASRIFWALGYHQAEYHIGVLRREDLTVDPKARFTPVSGRVRPMKLSDVEPVLERVARKADGSYRVLASRLLPGKILGGFKYHATRPDDPNDIVPHEERRELRALKVFGAWTNLVDIKALNTMDTLISDSGGTRVRHYLLDVGSTFGIGANGPHDWTDGYEHLFEPDKSIKRIWSLGLYLQPWQTVDYPDNKSIGRFEGDEFDPLLWQSRIPVPALTNALDDDTFWAARRVMAFTDELIRAVVKTGQYSDPAAEKLLADILIKRRNRIGSTYLTRINPLVNFSLDASGALRFENAAEQTGVSQGRASFKSAWFEFANDTGALRPIGETAGSTGEIMAPARLPATPGAFVAVDLSALPTAPAAWVKPVRVTFVRTGAGWKWVGLQRTL